MKIYYQISSSVTATRRKLDSEYGTRNGVANSTISDLIKKFEEHGTVYDMRQGNVGSPKTVTEKNIARVQEKVQ
ncbi:hypothetical protein TNCV_2781451 [Trichonephila clavipes]|nr:hypothetical protein TNCV_2781451 [Trichonephila clavipes]